MIRSAFSIITAITVMIMPALPVSAGQLTLTTSTGKRLTFDYCWIDGDQVKFEIGGGTATLPKNLLSTLDEIIDRKEIVPEALEKTAVTVESFDPRKALKDTAARIYGISIEFTDKPAEQTSETQKASNLYGAVTKVVPELSMYQLIKRPPKEPTIFVTVFFNARMPIDKNDVYVELLDMDGNPADRIPATTSLLDLPKKERLEKKIAPLFYVAYAFIPAEKQFWTYQFVLKRMAWDQSPSNRSAYQESNFKTLRF